MYKYISNEINVTNYTEGDSCEQRHLCTKLVRRLCTANTTFVYEVRRLCTDRIFIIHKYGIIVQH